MSHKDPMKLQKKRCRTFTGGQRKLQYKIQIQLNEIYFTNYSISN